MANYIKPTEHFPKPRPQQIGSYAELYQPEPNISEQVNATLASLGAMTEFGKKSPEDFASLIKKYGPDATDNYTPEKFSLQMELFQQFIKSPLSIASLKLAELAQKNPQWKEWSEKAAKQIEQRIAESKT